MTTDERTPSLSSAKRRRVLWAIGLSLWAASCISVARPRAGAQYWDADRGPVVPHDSFPADCQLCHAGGGWQWIRSDFQFDHGRQTGVVLAGAHQNAECLRCHNDRGPVAAFAKRSCAGCHQDEHRGQLGNRCDQCHNENTWVPEGQVMLHNRTRFPLVGAHTAVACFRCHPGAQVGNLIRAPVQCAACHQADLQRAANPPHAALGWTQNCQDCHQPLSWQTAHFDHSRFPLTGAHQTAACTACHRNGVFTGLATACASCHLADYNATRSPNHVAAGFSTSCQDCHTTASWLGVMFNHQGITNNCVACHMSDYQATTNPNHGATGISTNCEDCHNTASWQGAMFNHQGITTNCVACHLSNYQATSNPNHTAAGFPTNCEACHGTNTWLGATFNHRFNITSGPHAGNNCAECHRTPSNYSVVSCTHCHVHSQARMNDVHSGEPGYVWSSPSCVSCHPNGR